MILLGLSAGILKADAATQPNYHTAKLLTKNLLAIDMRKNQILMNKPVYLGL